MRGYFFMNVSWIIVLFSYEPEAIAVDVYDLHAAVFFQIFAQFGDVYVHAAAVEVGVAAPYALQRQFAWQQVVLVFAQHQQQFIFLRRKGMTVVAML